MISSSSGMPSSSPASCSILQAAGPPSGSSDRSVGGVSFPVESELVWTSFFLRLDRLRCISEEEFRGSVKRHSDCRPKLECRPHVVQVNSLVAQCLLHNLGQPAHPVWGAMHSERYGYPLKSPISVLILIHLPTLGCSPRWKKKFDRSTTYPNVRWAFRERHSPTVCQLSVLNLVG